MYREQAVWKLLGVTIFSFGKQLDGEIVGNGLLNPLIERFGLFATVYFQQQFRALWSLVKTRLLVRPFPTAVTFAADEAKRAIDETTGIGVSVIAFTRGSTRSS
jgi:hypothetical protein